jgi:beta-N-acetylhexosaminidase
VLRAAVTPAIFGLAGPVLTADERTFFRDANPAGFILFGRNVREPEQLRALTDSLRETAGRDVPILIDQEGGAVARLGPPGWAAFPAATAFDRLYERAPSSAIAAARANGAALGAMLAAVGITVNCAPVLDLGHDDTTAAVAPRVFGREPMRVAALGRATLEGLAEAGVLGVLKHMPGHGRASVDSHVALPRVTASDAELEVDVAPFRTLAARATMGMTCHVVFEAWDAEHPATLSPVVIGEVIRSRIGFDGLLITDDIEMRALSGAPSDKTNAALAAGCDVVLHCSGTFSEMVEIAARVPAMTDRASERLERAMASRKPGPVDQAEQSALRDRLLSLA